MIRAWTASLLLHLLLAGILLGLGHRLTRPSPLRIEVELIAAPPRQPAAEIAPAPEPQPQAPRGPAAKPLLQASPPRPVAKPVARPTPPPTAAARAKLPPEPQALPEPSPTPSTVAATTASPAAPSPPATGPAASISLAGPSPAAPAAAAAPKEHPPPNGGASESGSRFNDIRDRVMAALRYPQMARRQGWRGEVRLEFTLLANGEVQDLKLVQSSGYPLLDRQALRAVEAAAPFPPPLATATITLPVQFRLE